MFLNEIVWCYKTAGASTTKYASKHDVLLYYSKSKNYTYHVIREPRTEKEKKRYNLKDENGNHYYNTIRYGKTYKYCFEDGAIARDWFILTLASNKKERIKNE